MEIFSKMHIHGKNSCFGKENFTDLPVNSNLISSALWNIRLLLPQIWKQQLFPHIQRF